MVQVCSFSHLSPTAQAADGPFVSHWDCLLPLGLGGLGPFSPLQKASLRPLRSSGFATHVQRAQLQPSPSCAAPALVPLVASVSPNRSLTLDNFTA